MQYRATTSRAGYRQIEQAMLQMAHLLRERFDQIRTVRISAPHQVDNKDISYILGGDFATPIPQLMGRKLTNLTTDFVISLYSRNLQVLLDFRASPAFEGLP